MAAVDDEFEAADDDWDDWNEPLQQMPATSLFDQFTGSVAEYVPCSTGAVRRRSTRAASANAASARARARKKHGRCVSGPPRLLAGWAAPAFAERRDPPSPQTHAPTPTGSPLLSRVSMFR